MEAQIQNMVTSASQVLLNPFLLAVPVVGVSALMTGFAGRIAVFVEDLRFRRSRPRHFAPGTATGSESAGSGGG